MNKDKIQVGDLVLYLADFRWRKGVGLVVAPYAGEQGGWKIYWFKYGRVYLSNEHYLTKLSPTQEKENE